MSFLKKSFDKNSGVINYFKMKMQNTKDHLSKKDFSNWIKDAEKSPTMSLEKFNKKWKEKLLQIKKII